MRIAQREIFVHHGYPLYAVESKLKYGCYAMLCGCVENISGVSTYVCIILLSTLSDDLWCASSVELRCAMCKNFVYRVTANCL